MATTANETVATPVGNLPIDSSGSPVSVVRLNPEESYVGVPQLLQRHINESSAEAWSQIVAKVDRTYAAVDHTLSELEEAIGFSARVVGEIASGKKLLFKPNLVSSTCIHPFTHGRGPGDSACTSWAFVAAVMRWFHDKLGITYHQMCVAEGGSSSAALPAIYGRLYSPGRPLTSEACMEGRAGDFYGGWGFYFARKYLAGSHDPSHADDPMQGYEESVSGSYIPPGRAYDRLMIYDINRTYDDPSKPRDVQVPQGANFRSITLHKVVTGGDPADPDDRRDYPGCFIVNLPKLKVHSNTLLTCAVKNPGIGFYPLQAANSEGPTDQRWKYGFPANSAVPVVKSPLPHSRWHQAVAPETGRPVKDEQGNLVFHRTAGVDGTMADVVKAVESCGATFLHVIDAVECTNIDHTGVPAATTHGEGLIMAGADPVAIDLLCAHYLFKTVPMAEARKLKQEGNLPGDFLQKVPLPRFDGKNIVTEAGYDSPITRDRGMEYAEARGLGRRDYYVIGRDLATGAPLASVEGHLGQVEAGAFVEVITATHYVDAPKFLWDMQATVMAYLAAVDEMQGTSYKRGVLAFYDENGDGIIDIDERGKSARVGAGPMGEQIRATEEFGFLRGPFYVVAAGMKTRRAGLNVDGLEIPRAVQVSALAYNAMLLSQSSVERPDPFVPGLIYGKGKWPSPDLVEHLSIANALYGPESPARVGANSLFGLAMAYADKALNGATYTGSKGSASDRQAIDKYLAAVESGAMPLEFTLYVPTGWGSVGGKKLPNVEESDDPARVFSASFGDGREVW